MKLDFDTNNIRKNSIDLLDCQVDLILRSLEFYCYTYNYIYPRTKKKFESPEAALRLSLIRETYQQILSQYRDSEAQNPVTEHTIDENIEKFKKIA